MKRERAGSKWAGICDLHRSVEREHVADFVDDEGEVLALVLDADRERILNLAERNAEAAAQADSGDDAAAQVDKADDVGSGQAGWGSRW